MKYFISTLLMLLFASYAFGQSDKTVRWQPNSDYSDSVISDGKEIKIITKNGISIAATLIEKRGWIPHAFITFENNTNNRILLDPALWTLNVITPKPQTLTTKEPEKLDASLENRAKWAAAIDDAGAAFSTKQTTATVTDSNGATSTATITEPDKQAQKEAATRGRAQQEHAGSVADYVRSSSLKVNTVFPKTQVSGIVWFENKKYKDVVLTIVIGDVIYEFPFVKK